MAFYDSLQQQTDVPRSVLQQQPFIQRGVGGELSTADYIAFLSQAYHHVKHTVPLLMACGARLPEHYEWLRVAVAEYIEEETGHEEWILNDIAAAGGDAEAVRDAKPNASTELMVAYAYDMIQRVNPLGFFGMVQVLEGTSIAVADAAADSIQRSLGLPNGAFSYLKSHGALDIEHVDFFKGLMNKITHEDDQRCIVHSATRFYQLYGAIFEELDRVADYRHAA